MNPISPAANQTVIAKPSRRSPKPRGRPCDDAISSKAFIKSIVCAATPWPLTCRSAFHPIADEMRTFLQVCGTANSRLMQCTRNWRRLQLFLHSSDDDNFTRRLETVVSLVFTKLALNLLPGLRTGGLGQRCEHLVQSAESFSLETSTFSR
jgi:hypothetical protein